MTESEEKESAAMASAERSETAPPLLSRARPVAAGAGSQSCSACRSAPSFDGAGAQSSYIYAIGRIEPRFPKLSIEKEFAQATGRVGTAGLTDRQSVQKVLSERQNRYLARQLCWVLTIEGLESYLLVPRDLADLDLLIEAVRPNPDHADIDVVIGVKGPLTEPESCNGLIVPIVIFDQLYSFDRESLLKAIPQPENLADNEFAAAAKELFDRVLQMADNAGDLDEHRALNYCAVRYPAIYSKVGEYFNMNYSLTGLDVQASALGGVRKIVDVILAFRNRATDVMEKFFCRVDVTEEFPFLVTKLSPYYDRGIGGMG